MADSTAKSTDGETPKTPSPSKKAPKEYKFPEGVTVPSSIDASMITGDMVDMLNELSVERIESALETYDEQFKAKGSEIRSPRAYLRGILKGLTGHEGSNYGLPKGVNVPSSITEEMLEEGDLIDVLKTISVRDINSCFRDFDDQMKKRGGDIRNKNAYLLGIIKTGSHFNLPPGVVIPSAVKLTMLKGEVLELLQTLPVVNINAALAEYDDMMERKGDTIRSKQGYLLGIVKRVKRSFDEEAAEHVAKTPSRGHTTPSSTKNGGAATAPTTHDSANGGSKSSTEPLNDTLGMLTEGFVKVTNELVVERQARNELGDKLRQSVNELTVEKETRARSEFELERLRKDLAFEKSLRENAEEKAQVLEASRGQVQQPTSSNEQIKSLQMELSIERGLREKTEKLLRTAEDRMGELKEEIKQLQDKLLEERTAELPPSLAGLSEFL
jgi:hypothetical protein